MRGEKKPRCPSNNVRVADHPVMAGLKDRLPLLTGREPLRLLCYMAAGYILLAPFTDSLSDTLIWAPLSMCVVARPDTKAEREAQREDESGGP